jgi:dolichol-phosphate mannosyltransferase
MKNHLVSVVVPIRNEEANIERLAGMIIDAFRNIPSDYEIIFVDDGSTDKTAKIVSYLKNLYDAYRVVLLLNSNKPGKDGALRTGFGFACGDIVATLDGDCQNDPADIPAMIGILKQCDMVHGVRVNRKDTFPVRTCSMIANTMRKMFFQDPTNDAGCGINVFRKKCLPILLKAQFSAAHCFFPAILMFNGFTVREMPVNHFSRHAGKSKFKLIRGRLTDGISAGMKMRKMVKYPITSIF